MRIFHNLAHLPQVRNKLGYFLFTHIFRMAFFVKQDITSYPVHVSLFSSNRIMLLPNYISNLIK